MVIKNGYKIEDATKLELLNRYQDSAIFLAVQKKDVKWLTTIEHLPYVKRIENCGDGFKIYVNHLEEDAHRLLQYGLDSNVLFTKFDLGLQESLEEIFLELVV